MTTRARAPKRRASARAFAFGLALAGAAGCSHSETATPSAASAPTSATGDASGPATSTTDASATATDAESTSAGATTRGDAALADVLSVSAAGSQWSVEVRSPDAGCERYADWWEVVTPGGDLIYRRILAHSHVDEQPFTRSGGPVEVGADDEVIVRAHMSPGGYGGQALRGSAGGGFTVDASIAADFAPALEQAPPLPEGCAF
ncbi:MAG: hypothetical protein R3A79_28230 [Nannocystaceae bacterium]